MTVLAVVCRYLKKKDIKYADAYEMSRKLSVLIEENTKLGDPTD